MTGIETTLTYSIVGGIIANILTDVLKGLIEIVINLNLNISNMFTRVTNNYTTNYKVEKGATLLQVVVSDRESAEAFANALKSQPTQEQVTSDTEQPENG